MITGPEPRSGNPVATDGAAVGRRRWRSVDTFRGAVLALMILTPATGAPTVYPWLQHAEWDGLTVSDAVFPTFLVTSGLSLAFLLRHPVRDHTKRRLVRRVALLVLIGLAYNAYGPAGFDPGTLRFTGVLQTIGVAGAITAAAVLVSRRPEGTDRSGVLAASVLVLTASYGLGLWLIPGTCSTGRCNPFGRVDTAVFGAGHVYREGTAGFDPEGLAPTIAASALVLIGYLAGSHLRRGTERPWHAIALLVASGLSLLAVGALLDAVQPVNKRLMTPSFVAVTAGVALCVFAAFVAALDARSARAGPRAAVWPLVALGRNALVVFLLERLLLQSATMVHVGDRTAQQWLLDVLPVGKPGANLAYTGLLLVIVLVVTGWLHRRRRYLAL